MVVIVIGPHTAAHTTAGIILLGVKQIDDDVCIPVSEPLFRFLNFLGFNVQETSPRSFTQSQNSDRHSQPCETGSCPPARNMYFPDHHPR